MLPAYKTNIGATKQAYCMLNAKSMKFVGFQLGNGGVRDDQILTVDRNTTVLPGLVGEFSSEYMTTKLGSGTSIKIVCNIPSGIASDYVSNIGLLAQIVGEEDVFLYAISNFPKQNTSNKLSFTITLNN